MKKVEETIVIRNEKMIYAVRLKSKTEGEDGRRENNNPYLIVEGGKIKYIDHIYGNKSEFNFNDEVHTVAKEIFISGLKNAIKEEILQLKQLELVLEEMNLKECIGDTLQEIVGHRRTAAAVLNIERGHDEFKLVDCKIKEMSESLFMLTLHSANIFNRQLSDWELTNGVAEFTKYLVKARESGELTIEGKMRDYIANVTGKSTGKINQINSINNNLCEEGKEAFKDGKINFSTAYETSRLPEAKQHEVIENGELLSKDVREMVKEEKEKKEAEKKPGDDYEPAHPESITSLCYSCLYYSECNVKTGTCEKCDKYTNKAEAEKTEEQKYEEEQTAIDRDTKAKLRQQSDDEKMETLPSEAAAAEPKTHIIRLAAMWFDDVASGKKSFELRKNDRGYKEGDVLELMEFKDGRNTGREIKADINLDIKMSVDTFCKRHSSRMSNNLLDGSFINAVFFHHGNCSVARTVWRPLNSNSCCKWSLLSEWEV